MLRITHVRDRNLTESRIYESRIWPNAECSEVPKCGLNTRHYNREVTTFGGSRDLVIYNNANTNTNQNSYSDLGYTYQPPAGYQYGTPQTMSLFAGSYN